jgi:GT2 family glycosyltransferase
MNKQIAILLTCHNRREKTIACLQSLYKCTIPENYTIDVFLVDDGSSDGTSEAVKNEFPQVNVIQGSGNLYWNRGMHLAWETAAKIHDYDYFLWLNDDTYLFQNSLEVILTASNLTKNKAIIVAATCSKHTGEVTYSGFKPDRKIIIPTDQLVLAATFNGNCILIPKVVYQTVGNLDPLFWHCIGDIDYGYRAGKKGIESFVAPGFLAYCEGHESLPKWCLKEVPFQKRMVSLYSPLGNSHPYHYFRFELRHFGILFALKHFLSIHLRVTFPQLWK